MQPFSEQSGAWRPIRWALQPQQQRRLTELHRLVISSYRQLETPLRLCSSQLSVLLRSLQRDDVQLAELPLLILPNEYGFLPSAAPCVIIVVINYILGWESHPGTPLLEINFLPPFQRYEWESQVCKSSHQPWSAMFFFLFLNSPLAQLCPRGFYHLAIL